MSFFAEAVTQSEGSPAAVSDTLRQRVTEVGGSGPLSAAVLDGLTELLAYAEGSLGEHPSVLDAETQAVEVSHRVFRPLLEAKLQAQLSDFDAQHSGEGTTCPKCSNKAESQGIRGRTWVSLLGRLSLQRRYASCDVCDGGVAPAQVALGLPSGPFTPRLEEVCTMMATTVPFGMATSLVGKLCGVEVSEKAVEDMIERRGNLLLARNTELATSCNPLDESGLPVAEQQLPPDVVADGSGPDVAYLEVDGVIPITREELTGKELSPADRRRQKRAKKQKARGGKGRRYRIVGREVKNAVLYDAKDCAAESPSRGSILKKTYVSHLGDWMSFALRLWVEMLRLRLDSAKRVVILSDGAEWIRSLAAWLPVPTFMILDLYHVSHRIWEVAHAVHGERTTKAATWARTQCERVEAGRSVDVVRALRFLKPKRAQTRELVEKLAGYLKDNRDRMDYPSYRAEGLRITSAAVESANFHVTGTRLKLQGMRWSAAGARKMAALRADLFNGRWEATTRQILAA